MIFSYYFDEQKIHQLNFIFDAQTVNSRPDGSIDLIFNASVEEVEFNQVKHKESKSGSFHLPAGAADHDIDFSRVRYAAQNKWIFETKNNRGSESVTVGLISATANKNPLGMDIYQPETTYTAQLKANNLAKLEPTYVPPILKQTLVSSYFTTGLPAGFESSTAHIDTAAQLVILSDLKQNLDTPIAANTHFTIDANVAPMSIDSVTGKLFDVELPGIGRLEVNKNNMQFVAPAGTITGSVAFDSPLTEAALFNSVFADLSKLSIDADGISTLTVKYAGKTLALTYDASVTVAYFTLVTGEQSADTTGNRISTRFDNLLLGYYR